MTDVAHHESMQFSLPRAVRSYFKDTYSMPSDSLRTIWLAETDYLAAIKRYYEGRKAAMGYLYYPDPYGFYNAWVDFANENKQPTKALQACDEALRSLQSVRGKYAGGAAEDYPWCEEEITEKAAEIKEQKK